MAENDRKGLQNNRFETKNEGKAATRRGRDAHPGGEGTEKSRLLRTAMMRTTRAWAQISGCSTSTHESMPNGTCGERGEGVARRRGGGQGCV